jgi:archaellum component FlaC
MSQDDLDHIPSIVPTRDTEPHFGAAGKPRPGKAGASKAKGKSRPPSGGSGSRGGAGLLARLFITLALLAAGAACGWAWQLQQQLAQANAQMQRYADRITDLEDRLSDTDEGLSQNTQAMAVKIKELYSEVDKLWASAWRRNKASIEELQGASDTQGKKVAALEKSMSGAESQLKAAAADLAKLKGVANDLERLMASAKANGAEVERVADTLNKINLELAKINQRVQGNEEWVGSINAFRRQVNSDLSALQTQLRNIQAASGTP